MSVRPFHGSVEIPSFVVLFSNFTDRQVRVISDELQHKGAGGCNNKVLV